MDVKFGESFQIRSAEKLIEKLDHDQLQITKELGELESLKRDYGLCREYKKLREEKLSIEDSLRIKKRLVIVKKISLQKLCFLNKAYQPKTNTSCLLGNELDTHRLCFRMLHGCKKLAEERRLMRDIKASQKSNFNYENIILSKFQHDWSSTDGHICYYRYDDDDEDKKILFNDLQKWLDLKEEETIVNCPIKGEIWNSLGSKRAVQLELKILNDEIDKIRKEKLEFRAKAECHKIKYKDLEKQKEYLKRKLMYMEQKKKEACELKHNLRMQYSKEPEPIVVKSLDSDAQKLQRHYWRRPLELYGYHGKAYLEI